MSDFVVNEDCPARRIHHLFGPKWTSMVLYILSHGPQRTGSLQRSMPGVSKKMLIQTLRELESDGLVHREVFNVVPPMVEYSLTDLGKRCVQPLIALYDWAKSNSEVLDEVEANRLVATASSETIDGA